jgi:hypothetical protein
VTERPSDVVQRLGPDQRHSAFDTRPVVVIARNAAPRTQESVLDRLWRPSLHSDDMDVFDNAAHRERVVTLERASGERRCANAAFPRRSHPSEVPVAWFVRAMLVLVFWASSAAAVTRLPPGLEKEVMHLVAGPEQLGPCKLYSIRITDFVVQLGLEGAQEKGLVELLPVESIGDGEKLGTTASFSVWLAEGSSAALKQSGRMLVERIAANDDGSFYDKAAAISAGRAYEQSSRTGGAGSALVEARDLGRLDTIRRAVTWAALLLLLGWSILRALAVGWRSRTNLIWWTYLAGLAAVATYLRLTLPPWAPIHANMHGIAELRGLAVPEALWRGPVETDRYGYAYRQVVRAFIGPWDGQVRAALGFSAVAGGLSVIPLAIVAARLLRSRWAGVVAGVALAVHPAHIILSKSETPMACCSWQGSLALSIDDAAPSGRRRWRLAAPRSCRFRRSSWRRQACRRSCCGDRASMSPRFAPSAGLRWCCCSR